MTRECCNMQSEDKGAYFARAVPSINCALAMALEVVVKERDESRTRGETQGSCTRRIIILISCAF